MDKDEILKASRRENRNRDLAELEVAYLAGSHASRVGALVCALISLLASWLGRIILYSPWAIYFSMLGTQWLVRFLKCRRKSDLAVAALFLLMAVLSLAGVVQRLLEVRG